MSFHSIIYSYFYLQQNWLIYRSHSMSNLDGCNRKLLKNLLFLKYLDESANFTIQAYSTVVKTVSLLVNKGVVWIADV
jgi:hypothetical protein